MSLKSFCYLPVIKGYIKLKGSIYIKKLIAKQLLYKQQNLSYTFVNYFFNLKFTYMKKKFNIKYAFVIMLVTLFSFTTKAVTTADAGNDTTVCTNWVQLHANSPASGETGTWSAGFGSSVTFSDIHDPHAIAYNLDGGGATNTLTWTLDDGSAWGGTSSDNVDIISNYVEPNAGSDDNVCGDSYTLSANDPSPNTGTWTVASGSGTFDDATNNTATISGLANGDNYLVWTIHQCDGTDVSDTVVITNNLVTANAGSDQTVCSSDAVLNANTPSAGRGTWSAPLGSGVIFDDTHDPNTTAHELPHGTTTLTWKINNNGCTNSDDVDINNDSATPSNAGPDQNICSDQTTLHANNPVYGSGVWSVASGTATFWDNTDRNTNASNLSFGSNQLVWTISTTNCESRDTVTVTNNLIVAYAGEDIASCYDTVQLNANNPAPGTGQWSTSTLVTFDDATLYNTVARNLSTNGAKLFWKITYNGCTSKDSVIVRKKNGTPTANAGTDQTLCADNTTLTATLNPGETGTWTTVSGSVIYQNINNPTSNITDLHQGANKLRWTVENNGCYDSDDVIITNNLPDKPNAGPDQTLCADNTTLQGNTLTIGTGQWSVTSGSVNFANANNPTTAITAIQQGANTLTYTATNAGCTLTDDVIITNDLPDAANAGTNQTVCADNFGPLSANNPTIGTGQWSVISGNAIFSNINSNTASVTMLNQGANTLRWTITHNACSLSSDVVITNDLPDNPFAGYDRDVCTDSTTMQANEINIGTLLWSDTANTVTFNDATNPTSLASNLAQGLNVLVLTATNNACSLSDTVVITNNRPTIPNAGIDSSICADNYILSANNPTIGTGEWSVVNGNGIFVNVNSDTSKVNNLLQGQNTLRWTITNVNCSLSDDVIITNDLPDKPNAGVDFATCSDSAQLNAVNPTIGTGIWTASDTLITFADSSVINTIVNNLPQAVDTLIWTLTNNACSLSDTVLVSSSQLTISNTKTDLSCFESNDGKINITVNGGFANYNYSWFNNTGSLNYNTANITNAVADTFYVVATDANNCSISDTIILNQPTQILSNSVIKNVLCHDDSTGSIQLYPNGGAGDYNYAWTVADSSYYNVTDSTLSHLYNLISGVYSVVITDSTNCSVSETYTINQPTQISLSADIIDNVCYGGYSGSIDLTVDGGTPAYTGYTYQWTEQNDSIVHNYSNGNFSSTDEDIDSLYAGTFNVVVTDLNNCKATATYKVNQPFEGMKLTAKVTDVSCKDQHDGAIDLTVEYGTSPYIYNWSNNEITEDLENLDGGSYVVTITDVYNCQITDTLVVNVKNIECIHIYNVFSPNGDGVNDTWDIDNIYLYPNVEINVFNQWGNKVFESTGYDKPWDGTYNGKILPAATYYYTLDLKNGDAPYSGSLTILK